MRIFKSKSPEWRKYIRESIKDKITIDESEKNIGIVEVKLPLSDVELQNCTDDLSMKAKAGILTPIDYNDIDKYSQMIEGFIKKQKNQNGTEGTLRILLFPEGVKFCLYLNMMTVDEKRLNQEINALMQEIVVPEINKIANILEQDRSEETQK